MVQSEVDVLNSAKSLFEARQYTKLRNFIWVSFIFLSFFLSQVSPHAADATASVLIASASAAS